MTTRTLVVSLILLLLCRCSATEQGESLSRAEDDIREAVFRYQFKFNVSGWRESASAFFLSLEEGEDPTPEFLHRFADHRPVVRPISASTLEPGTAQILDQSTGLPALVFRIDDIRWLTDDRAEVDGGYYEASESATGNTYRVVKESGRWVVSGVEMLWIK